jgi:hypothetical protein
MFADELETFLIALRGATEKRVAKDDDDRRRDFHH